MQLICLCPVLCTSVCVALVAPVTAWLAALLGAAVNELTARFAQPIQRKRGPCAVAQQPLQRSAVVRLNAHTGIDRKPTVFVPQHLLGLEAFEQAPAHKGAQDASAQVGLGFGHRFGVDAGGRVEDDTRRTGLRTGLSLSVSTALARHFLKHAIDCADVEVHMLIEAGAKAVDEGDCADVQCGLVHMRRTRAVDLQRLCNDPQKDAQHHAQHRAISLHEVTQSLGH